MGAGRIGDALAGSPVPQEAIDVAKESVGAAEVVAQQAGAQAGPQAQAALTDVVNQSFVQGWHAASWVCMGVVLLGAAVAWRWLPARSDVDALSGTDPAGLTLGDPVDAEVREPATAA